jgi:PAS domain S-box-containing protein
VAHDTAPTAWFRQTSGHLTLEKVTGYQPECPRQQPMSSGRIENVSSELIRQRIKAVRQYLAASRQEQEAAPGRPSAKTAARQHLELALKELDAVVVELGRQREKPAAVGRVSTTPKPAGETRPESEAWYRQLFEIESDAILMMDGTTFRFLDVNPASTRLYGYSHEEFLKLKLGDVSAEPEKTMQAVAAREAHIPLRWHRKKEGTVFPVEVAGSYFTSGGREICVAVIRDMTARRQVEEALQQADDKYRAIIENAAEGFFQSTPDGKLLAINRAFATMHGFASPEECMAAVHDCAHQFYTDPGHRAELRRRLETQGEVRGFENQTRRKDGSMIWVSTNARVVRDAEGRVRCYEGLVQDITERKWVEQRLLASQEQLRMLAARLQGVREEERARIAREIHDEMGHAFTDLKLDLAWLDRRLDEQKQSGQSGVRRRIAVMMKRVEDDLNTARRISTELRPAVLDMSDFTAAIEWEAKQFEERSGIECELELPPEGMALDSGRSTAMFRIFQEVLANVTRHAGARRVHARLWTEDGQAVMDVSDDGRGITSREMGGASAMGLLGMRERAREFGGEVAVHGVPGKGTTVRVAIPLKQP